MDTKDISDAPPDKLGMTDEQWEWFQKATHGYGDQDENGIDLSLLRENLRLTPTERLEKNQRVSEFIAEVRRAGKEAGIWRSPRRS